MKRFVWDRSSVYRASIFFYPFFCVLILGFFLIPFALEYLKETIAFGCLTLLLYSLFLLFPKPIKNVAYFLFLMVLSLLTFFKLAFYFLYNVKPSVSALFVVFETNFNETKEYLNQYLSFPVISLGIFIFLPLLFTIAFFIRKPNAAFFSHFNKTGLFKKIIFAFLVVGCGYIIHWKFSQENLFLKGYYSFKEYREFKELIKSTISKSTSNYFQAVSKEDSTTETLVVVIGESTTKWHMQLYGYERETNPKLNKIANELLIFEDVISPHVHTILSLEKTLTFATFEDPKPVPNASIIQMANEAGFETYWISNQQPIGVYESLSTMIANAAKHKYFMATEGYKYTIHDEALLPVLEDVLEENPKKKVVFVHLIGTHVAYRKRYPKEYDVFYKNSRPSLSAEANEYINNYDNAVRYNDYIVREIIEMIRPLKGQSAMVYFSDHGDDVFDVGDKLGHNEYNATPPMYEVPFILWASKNHPLQEELFIRKDTVLKRPYHLENFPYSFANLGGISFQKNDSSKSIFSKEYRYHKRIIKDTLDYDEN